jgi:hypothetical protein
VGGRHRRRPGRLQLVGGRKAPSQSRAQGAVPRHGRGAQRKRHRQHPDPAKLEGRRSVRTWSWTGS